MSKKEIHWVLESHLCRACGGRVLRAVANVGPTGGGNPLFRCADCGRGGAAMGADALCWCGFHFKGSAETPYRCALKSEHPEWESEFRASGTWDAHGEVGMVSEAGIRRLARAQEEGQE